MSSVSVTELETYCVCSEDVQTFGKLLLEGKIQLICRKSRNSFSFTLVCSLQ